MQKKKKKTLVCKQLSCKNADKSLHQQRDHLVAVAEILRKLILGNFQTFVLSGQDEHAASIGTIHFCFYREPNKNCIILFKSQNYQKICLSRCKMTSLDQNKIVMKIANLRVSKLRISFKGINRLESCLSQLRKLRKS